MPIKVSVVTPTIRPDGLPLVEKALAHQNFKDFEWLIGSPFKPKVAIPHRWVRDNYIGGFWTLNRIYNQLFRKAKGEIIVTWQDYIWAPPEALQKFVAAVKRTFSPVSGVGDQYAKVDELLRLYDKVWADPRKTSRYGSFYECTWKDCEWNFAAFPRALIFVIGGMDEELDFRGYGGDQYQVCERWNDAGISFYLDQANESFTLRHGRDKDWDKNHVLFNGEYERRKKELKESGEWPILDYLTKK